jgi:hypothetical protein
LDMARLFHVEQASSAIDVIVDSKERRRTVEQLYGTNIYCCTALDWMIT